MMKNYLSSYESDEEDDQNEEEEEKEEEEEEEELEEVSEEEEEEEESEDEFADEFAVADGIAQQYDFVVEYCLSVAAVVEHICKHCIARSRVPTGPTTEATGFKKRGRAYFRLVWVYGLGCGLNLARGDC